jgi:putative hydrolase of the HAD superfamily
MKKNYLIFDLSGVISKFVLQDTEPIIINNKRAIPADFEKIYYSPQFNQYMRGATDYQTFIKPFLNQIKPQLTLKEFARLFYSSIHWVEKMQTLLPQLTATHKLILLTNEGIEFANWKIEKLGIEDYFQKIFISAELGMVKPEPEIYHHVLKKMKLKPKNCLFIDDSKENTAAAHKIGIQSILFKSTDQLHFLLKNT